MRHLFFIIFATAVLAGAANAAEKTQSHKAMAHTAPGPRAACLDRYRLTAEHTAYTPSAAMMPPRCGQLLSTDTLISTMHHWDQT
jgi:hypothetical protein